MGFGSVLEVASWIVGSCTNWGGSEEAESPGTGGGCGCVLGRTRCTSTASARNEAGAVGWLNAGVHSEEAVSRCTATECLYIKPCKWLRFAEYMRSRPRRELSSVSAFSPLWEVLYMKT